MRIRLALIGVALGLGWFAGPAVASMLTWSAPSLVDQRVPFEVPEGVTDLSCPSVRLCVGTQASGVEISRHPLEGAGSWAITRLPVTPGFPLDTISCASMRLCVAVNYRGQVFTSTNPTGGAGAWRGSNVRDLSQASSVNCPRVRFCIALNGLNVVVSTKPTRPSSWRVINVISGGPFSSIACPSRKLCVGTVFLGGWGAILTTTSPTGSGFKWNATYERGPSVNFADSGVACPSTHLCVATDVEGNIFTSTNPARRRWKMGRLPGISPQDLLVNLASLSCPSVHLCVAVSPQLIAWSTNPAGGARTWRMTGPPSPYPSTGLQTDALACASARLCVATLGDLVSATAHAARGAPAWSSSYLDQGYNPLKAIACPSDQFCAAMDAGGNLLTSSAPAASATAWNLAPLGIGPQTDPKPSLACPSASFCAGTTTSGSLITSPDPSNPAAWSSTAVGQPDGGLNDVSCPTATFCASSDGLGAIHVSRDPSGGATAWSSQQVGAPVQCVRQYCNYDALIAVSCPSLNLCATTDRSQLWTSTDPSAGNAVWLKSPLSGSVNTLDCPTESLCLAASGATLQATTDPADPSPRWTSMNLPKVVIPAPAAAPAISGLSCVSAQECVAVDQAGGYAFVGNPSDPNSWVATKIDDSSLVPDLFTGSLTAVSCTPTGRCVATDGAGDMVIGTTSG